MKGDLAKSCKIFYKIAVCQRGNATLRQTHRFIVCYVFWTISQISHRIYKGEVTQGGKDPGACLNLWLKDLLRFKVFVWIKSYKWSFYQNSSFAVSRLFWTKVLFLNWSKRIFWIQGLLIWKLYKSSLFCNLMRIIKKDLLLVDFQSKSLVFQLD